MTKDQIVLDYYDFLLLSQYVTVKNKRKRFNDNIFGSGQRHLHDMWTE